ASRAPFQPLSRFRKRSQAALNSANSARLIRPTLRFSTRISFSPGAEGGGVEARESSPAGAPPPPAPTRAPAIPARHEAGTGPAGGGEEAGGQEGGDRRGPSHGGHSPGSRRDRHGPSGKVPSVGHDAYDPRVSVPPAFVHTHVHSHYSLLDGAAQVEDLVEAA